MQGIPTRVDEDRAFGSCVHPGTLRLCGRLLLESGGQHTCDWGQVDLGKSSLVLWGRFIGFTRSSDEYKP